MLQNMKFERKRQSLQIMAVIFLVSAISRGGFVVFIVVLENFRQNFISNSIKTTEFSPGFTLHQKKPAKNRQKFQQKRQIIIDQPIHILRESCHAICTTFLDGKKIIHVVK